MKGAQNIHFGREGGSLGNCVLPEGVLQGKALPYLNSMKVVAFLKDCCLLNYFSVFLNSFLQIQFSVVFLSKNV